MLLVGRRLGALYANLSLLANEAVHCPGLLGYIFLPLNQRNQAISAPSAPHFLQNTAPGWKMLPQVHTCTAGVDGGAMEEGIVALDALDAP